MTSWNRFPLILLLLGATACATQQPRTTAADRTPEREIIAREQRLAYLIADERLPQINTILARDFRCAVAGSEWFTFERETARGIACTGVGGSFTYHPRPAWISSVENELPRRAVIDEIGVKVNGGTAHVVSTQSLSFWSRGAGPTPHRFRLTDTWSLIDGQWRLVRRYSEPLSDQERIARMQ